MNSWDKFEETRLPSIDKFYSKLIMSGISESEYQYARNVWDKFKLKNMGDYHDLYLKTDVILLTNVFELFRSVCLSNYGLDPAHFYTAPGFAWKACLKKTGVNLELLKDPDMLLMFERGIRGGIEVESLSRFTDGLLRIIHTWVTNTIQLNQLNTFNTLDANNLYGWAMSQPLPIGEFRWIDVRENKVLHFYTAPGFAWKACLKKTGVNLELLKDPDMLLMFERGIRGGITQSVHRWAIANNPYMGYEYDSAKPTEYLQYFGC